MFSSTRHEDAFSIFIRILMIVFLVAFYLPISSKLTNNIFYLGIAIPVFFWIVSRPLALAELMRPFAWFFLAMVSMAALMGLHNLSLIMPVLYLSIWFFCCLILRQRSKYPTQVFTTFAVTSLLLLAFSVVDWLVQRQDSGEWIRQVLWGQTINPVHAALLIVSSLVYLWVFHIEAWLTKYSRGHMVVGFFVLTALILLCASIFQARSALLGFALFLAAYLWQRRLVWVGLFCLVGALCLLQMLGLTELLLKSGTSYRLVIWQDAMQHLTTQCNVMLGCGSDNYRFLTAFNHPHSAYLSVLYRYGLLGAAIFSFFAVSLFWHAGRVRSNWLFVALIGWGGVLTTSSGVFTTPRPLWIYFWLPSFMALLDGHEAALAAYFSARERT